MFALKALEQCKRHIFFFLSLVFNRAAAILGLTLPLFGRPSSGMWSCGRQNKTGSIGRVLGLTGQREIRWLGSCGDNFIPHYQCVCDIFVPPSPGMSPPVSTHAHSRDHGGEPIASGTPCTDFILNFDTWKQCRRKVMHEPQILLRSPQLSHCPFKFISVYQHHVAGTQPFIKLYALYWFCILTSCPRAVVSTNGTALLQ